MELLVRGSLDLCRVKIENHAVGRIHITRHAQHYDGDPIIFLITCFFPRHISEKSNRLNSQQLLLYYRSYKSLYINTSYHCNISGKSKLHTMYFTKSTILHTALFAGTLSVAIPAPERPVTSHNAIAKRANPTIGKSAIAKRETPRIGDGIDTSNPFQGGKLVSPSGTSSGAFATAMELIYYANTATGARNDAVFAKYFNPGDRQNVTLIFDRLLGPDGVSGAEALVNIQVISGEEEPGDPAPAALEGYEYEDPNLVLTDDAL